MGEDVRLEVGGLGKLLIAPVKRANVGPVTCMDSHVGSQVEVERKSLPAAFERALERLLARVHQLMALELGRLDEGLAALGTYVHPWTVRVLVLAHRRIVAEHFGATLVRTGNGPDRILVPSLLLWLHSVFTQTRKCVI